MNHSARQRERKRMLQARDYRGLWADLGNTDFDEEYLGEPNWLHFPAGTHRETIWRWFEDEFDISVGREFFGGGK